MENHILYTVGNWNLRTNFPRAKNMFFSQGVGKAGKYGFGFACKYCRWPDDSLRTGRQIFKNQDRGKTKYQAGICYSAETACEGSIWQKDDAKCENFGCKAVSYQTATGRLKELQFYSYYQGSAATSLSDGGG